MYRRSRPDLRCPWVTRLPNMSPVSASGELMRAEMAYRIVPRRDGDIA
ncbi:hypothetical protein [Chromohalobacter canadensis]|nr:hypothetical protein [Chromohalobacter canadensis]